MNFDVLEPQTPGWKEPSSAARGVWEGARAHPRTLVHPHPTAGPSRSMGWACVDPSCLRSVQRAEGYLTHSALEAADRQREAWGMTALTPREGIRQDVGQVGPWKGTVSPGALCSPRATGFTPLVLLSPLR